MTSCINTLRSGGAMSERYPLNLRQMLERAVAAQPRMALDLTTRGKGKIPLADSFAKAAAYNDLDRIATLERQTGKPHSHTPSPQHASPDL